MYPYGKCWSVEVPEFSSLHYMKIMIEFTDVNIGYNMKVTDSSRWSFVPYTESFWGHKHKVYYKNGTHHQFYIFNMQLQEHVMDSKDTEAKCSNMDLRKSKKNFHQCLSQKTGEIFNEILGCVPPIFGQIKTHFCRNVEKLD